MFRFGDSLSQLDFINGVTQLYVTNEDTFRKLTRTFFKDFVSSIDTNMDGYIVEEEYVHSKEVFGHHNISNIIENFKLLKKPNGISLMDMVEAEYEFATNKDQSLYDA